jgi:hypothetical protein
MSRNSGAAWSPRDRGGGARDDRASPDRRSGQGRTPRGDFTSPDRSHASPGAAGAAGQWRSSPRHTPSPRGLTSHLAKCVTEEDVVSAVQTHALDAVQRWRDRKGGSLLHVVAKNPLGAGGVRECLRVGGFDPNLQRTSDGCTPLHLACFNKKREDGVSDIAQLLLHAGARRDIMNTCVIPT